MKKQKFMAFVMAAGVALLHPVAVLAQAAPTVYDARLEGYFDGQNPKGATLPGGSSLLWIIMLVLMALCAGVMFKHSKRTHLD